MWPWQRRRPERPAQTSASSKEVAEAAATWLIRIHADDLSRAERVEFMRWLKQSAVHVAEYLCMAALRDALQRADLQPYAPTAAAASGTADCSAKTAAPAVKPQRSATSRPLSDAAIVKTVRRTADGALVEAIHLNWSELVRDLLSDPALLHKLHWRKVEEIVAAAYDRYGYEVELTPRSNDLGRDVIATRRDVSSIRVFDQVKAYGPHRRVQRTEVLAVVGVLETQGNFSKAYISTTSDFAPGIMRDRDIVRLMPFRMELRNGVALLNWLSGSVANSMPS